MFLILFILFPLSIHSIFYCFGNPSNDIAVCSNHGNCVANNTCVCHNYFLWEGSNCNITKCNNVSSLRTNEVCNGGKGICTENHYCASCETDYVGKFCDVPICFNILANVTGEVCSAHGECVGADNCSCVNENYFGNDCSGWKCGTYENDDPRVCSFGNGTCIDFNNCSCGEEGYYGSECEYWDCDGRKYSNLGVCNGRGRCIRPEICECFNHYFPPETFCDKTKCFGVDSDDSSVCNYGNGTCVDYNNCSCSEGYYGRKCENWECNGIHYNRTSLVCSGRGSCVHYDICDCFDHYFYPETFCNLTTCDEVDSDDLAVCNFENGTCIDYNNCSCSDGYYEEFCQKWDCGNLEKSSPNVCSKHGYCAHPEECICNDHWFLPETYCNETTCGIYHMVDPNACNYGNGTCVGYNNCSCNRGYYGDECMNWDCDDIPSRSVAVCHGHGRCTFPDICICNNYTLFSGTFCGMANCQGHSDPSVACNGRGNCTENNVCNCTVDVDLWGGGFCQIPKCNGTLSTDNQVCDGDKGLCTEYHICECDNPNLWTGDYCEVPLCNEISKYNDSVCLGRGSCESPNYCECSDKFHWGGNDCEVPKCDGIIRTNETYVCSGRGTCNMDHLCTCDLSVLDDWGGVYCGTPKCNKIIATNRSVCNRRGLCVSPDLCSCQNDTDQYGGDLCDVPVCFGKVGTLPEACGSFECDSPNDCSCSDELWNFNCSRWKCQNVDYGLTDLICNFGMGRCIAPDICNCTTEDYYGVFCEEMIEANGIMNLEKTEIRIKYSIPHSLPWLTKYGMVELVFPCTKIIKNDDRLGSGSSCEFNHERTVLTINIDETAKYEDNDVIEVTPASEGTTKCFIRVEYPHEAYNHANWITPLILGLFFVIMTVIIIAGLVLMIVIFGMCVTFYFQIRRRRIKSRKFSSELMENLLEEDDIETIKRLTGTTSSIKQWKYVPLDINHDLFVIDPDTDLQVDYLIGHDVVGTSIYKARWRYRKEGGSDIGESSEITIRYVTLKLIKDKNLFKQEAFDLFERELKLIDAISHPTILRYYGAALNEPLYQVSLVLDYYENGNLKAFIRNHKSGYLEKEKKIAIIRYIALGMEHLHSLNIHHGDLRTENIFLDKRCFPKISSDFGVNRILKRIYAYSKGIESREIENIHYVAPEITNDDDRENLKSDVFSFAIITYEIFTENFDPFNVKDDDVGIEQKIASDPSFRPEIDEKRFRHLKEVSTIMEKGWKHDMETRPNFKEILKLLEKKDEL